MYDEVIEALREPLCSGVIPWGALTLSGSIEEGPADFWQGERAISAFDTEKATLGRELQTPIGRVLARGVTGRVLFKRVEAEVWLAGLDARASEASRRLPQSGDVTEYLIEHGIADGKKTEAECRAAAESHFGMKLPDKRVWRPAWDRVSSERKLRQGEKPKR